MNKWHVVSLSNGTRTNAHTRECTHVVCAHMHTHARTHTHTHTEHAVAMDYRWPLMMCGIVTSFAGE